MEMVQSKQPGRITPRQAQEKIEVVQKNLILKCQRVPEAGLILKTVP